MLSLFWDNLFSTSQWRTDCPVAQRRERSKPIPKSCRLTIPILRQFLIGIRSECLSTSLRNRYRHDFGMPIDMPRNPQLVAIDADSKLVISWLTGRRDA